MTGSLARPAAAGQSPPATPALLPSGYLVAALLLLVLAPPAILGWLAGAVVVRFGSVSRGRLAVAASVTGALALLVIGPTVAASRLLGAVATLVLPRPPHPDRWRRPGGPGRDPDPWAGAGRGRRPGRGRHRRRTAGGGLGGGARADRGGPAPSLRAEARDHRRAERLAQSPRAVASDALGVALDSSPGLPSWRRGCRVVPRPAS
jgi:hypothetical protein